MSDEQILICPHLRDEILDIAMLAVPIMILVDNMMRFFTRLKAL